jgi:hypothetical protein
MGGIILSLRRAPNQLFSLRFRKFHVARWAVVLGCLLTLAGSVLMAFTLLGAALSRELAKAAPVESTGPAALAAYHEQLRRGAPFYLVEATEKVHRCTTHFDGRRIGLAENWLQWALGKLYPPLARTQDPQRLLAGGAGDCSERSAILKALAETAGRRCRFVGLGGHVVLEVEAAGGSLVADPDYGIVFPADLSVLQSHAGSTIADQVLSARGYDRPTIDRYLEILRSREDNVALPIGNPLSPRLFVVERACQWLVWLLPLAWLGAGITLLRACRFAPLPLSLAR